MTTTTLPMPAKNKIAWPSFLWIGAIHLGALMAFVPAFFSWKALAVAIFMHWLTGGIGICLCYHRLLTHRSFALRPAWLEYVFTAIGCAASEGGPVGWVADHRKHHAHSDENPGDVHTPHQGFLWAHMLWWLTPDGDSTHTPEYLKKYAPDLARDPVLMWFDRWHFIFPILSAFTLWMIGGMPFLVWGFFVSTVVVLHTTWLVNSATHVWGYRSHHTRDDSTNLWWVALLTYGEGWHNNHHAYQTSARHGLDWWEVDMTYLAIKLMSMLGIAHTIKLPKLDRAIKADAVNPDSALDPASGDLPPAEAVAVEEENELVAARTDR
ncbi:MAG: fatty acid desaturase [Isosphaeraceae bacterium]